MSTVAAARALNANAERDAEDALRAAQYHRHAHPHQGHPESKLALPKAIALCEEALQWGHTARVLHCSAHALLELGKHHLLDSEDKQALDRFEEAEEKLEEVDMAYEGLTKVQSLKLEIKLDRANSLAALGETLKATALLAELDTALPRAPSNPLRQQHMEQQQQLRQMRGQSSLARPYQTSSADGARDRGRRVTARRQARQGPREDEDSKKRRRDDESGEPSQDKPVKDEIPPMPADARVTVEQAPSVQAPSIQQPPAQPPGGAQARVAALEVLALGAVQDGPLFPRIAALEGQPDSPAPCNFRDALARIAALESMV